MIKDLNDYPEGIEIEADVCIIGGGVAGLSIASELAGSHQKVVVLEAGGRKDEADTQMLYESEVVGLEHDGVHNGRFRVFGGSSTRWGAQLMTLERQDFEARDYIDQSAWPISFAEVNAFIDRAQSILRVNDESYEADFWERINTTPLPFDSGVFKYRFSKWAAFRNRNLAKTVGPSLDNATNVDVVLHANAIELVPDQQGRTIQSVRLKSLQGRNGSVRASIMILCAGAIESARLLLASNSVMPCGVGNQNDLVGRYFQDHISIRVGTLKPSDRKAFTRTFDPVFRGDTMHSCKLPLTAETQALHKTLNVMGHVVYGFTEESGLYELRKVLRAVQSKKNPLPSPMAAWRILRYSSSIFQMAFGQMFAKRRISPKFAKNYLALELEQMPSPDSRVTLADKKDALGMPLTTLDWRLTELEKHSMQVYTRLFREDWDRLDLGNATWNESIFASGDDWLEDCTDTYHQCGTTRMSNDPRLGVVDANLKVHELDNLYVASTSTFPSSGCGNPTLTMMALCLRLADHLKSNHYEVQKS